MPATDREKSMSEHDKPLGGGEHAAITSETETPAPAGSPAAKPQGPAGAGASGTSPSNTVPDRYRDRGGNGGGVAGGEDQDRPRFLRMGVDSLYLSYSGDLDPRVEEKLQTLKRLAQHRDRHQQSQAQYQVGDQVFEVKDKGSGFFPYVLENEAFRISFASSEAQSLPLAYVKISSDYLTCHTPEDAVDELTAVVREFGEVESFPTVSRIDIFVDFQSRIDMESWNRESWVTRASSINSYSVDGKFSGWAIGMGGVISFRLYDKTLEIAIKGWKQHLLALWDAKGRNPDLRVWRAELQYRREALKQLGLGGHLGVLDSLRKLWHYGIEEWLKLTSPQPEDSNRARWPLHPLWIALGRAPWDGDDFPLLRQFPKGSSPRDERLFRLSMSLLLSFMAKYDKTDFYSARQVFMELVEGYHVERCMDLLGIDFDEWVAKEVAVKRRKWHLGLNALPGDSSEEDENAEIDSYADAYRKASDGE